MTTETYNIPTPVWDGELTEQFYYDTTVEYLRSPNSYALSGEDKCLYLNEQGIKCAVGLWIPDGHEAQKSIHNSLAIAEKWPDLAGVAWPDTKRGLNLVALLQMLHDSPKCRTTAKGGLSEMGEREALAIAFQYNLIYTPPVTRP